MKATQTKRGGIGMRHIIGSVNGGPARGERLSHLGARRQQGRGPLSPLSNWLIGSRAIGEARMLDPLIAVINCQSQGLQAKRINRKIFPFESENKTDQ
ncbi:hypothetical protein [Paraburkholderia elongata]|uniref:Uncharacterized protein n=1 Tax=Paraburkholderia elongata TaxID=2675747 RepID=A0A972SH56_9BURK|nr:hypothetical protein [Paraburkholderia elongata]NPT54567.1 hypothetical protein [Paraburkholderia elongata]